MHNNFKRHQQGISLIELMIAGFLGLLLSIAVVQLVLTNSENYRTQQAMSEVQQSAFFAMNFMTGELRKAGYSGNMTRFEKKFRDYENGGIYRVASLVDDDVQTGFNGVKDYRALVGYYHPNSKQVPPVILLNGRSDDAADDNTESDSITIQYLVQNGDTTCAVRRPDKRHLCVLRARLAWCMQRCLARHFKISIRQPPPSLQFRRNHAPPHGTCKLKPKEA